MVRSDHPLSGKAAAPKELPQQTQQPHKPIVARFLRRPVVRPPVAWRLEAASPQSFRRASGSYFGILIVTISNRPTRFHHHTAEIPPIRLAARQQPSVAVTLPAGADDRLA